MGVIQSLYLRLFAKLCASRLRAEPALRERERRFRQAVEAAPNAMVMIGRAGEIVMVNAQAERVFGYARADLVGQPVEMLVPEGFRARHPELRQTFFSDPKARPMGAGRDLYGVRKDGSEFPVEIGLNPIETDEGTLVLSAIVDITQRKAAELAVRESERRFRQVVEAAPNAMVMIGRAGEIVMVNAQAERAFGYARAELVGQPVEMLVPERFRARHPELRRTFFSDPKPRPMGAGRDLYGVRKDGSEFPVEIGLNPIETDEGTLVLSAIVDITQRKAAELALRESERRFRKVVEAAPNAMVMIGRAGEIVMVNAQAERAFGYARAELVGQPVEMLVPERFRARHPKLRRTFFSDPKPRPMGAGRDLYGVRKDGSEFPVEIGLNPIETDGENMMVSAIVDITQRKAADLALRERELARINRLMHMFALTASIANEVNQPITAVVSSASAGLRWLAAQPPDLESARQSLRRIIQAGERAGEVTGRIGALVKQAPTRTDRLNVNDVIREALAMAQPELQKNRVKLRNGLLSDVPVVLADRVQLQQVLLNLIGNAIEAMTGVGESARELAVISGSGDAAGVFVEVRDSGPGLDQAQLERLFDPFYTTKPEGLGMGLAISRSIIEAHGGRLWAEPNQPSGAAFRFTLPVAEETSTDPVPSEA